MAKYQAGSRVINIDTKKKGVVVSVSDYIRGRQYYIVKWESYESEELETDLIEDCDISNVFERCKRGLFGSYSDYSQKNTSSKIQSSNNSTISSLKASKTLFRTYQFKPLLKFINSPTRRLLVADEVGLGKTIEAGHIMLELKARRMLRNVLVICPKSLQVKWREELNEKFGLRFKIYESVKDLIDDFEVRNGHVRAIINYEKIQKKDKNNDEVVEKHPNSLVDYLESSGKKLSFVLCDEAHKLRNPETQRFKGAEVIMDLSEAAVFLTATPIMLGPENLYYLLHLLDSTRYFNLQIFNARLQENAPFVKAITALNKMMPLKSIAESLFHEVIRTTYYNSDKVAIYNITKSVEEVYEKDPIFQEIKDLLLGEDTKKNRARLQYLLNSMSVMNNIFSRTRKKDVFTDMSQAKRDPLPQQIVLTDNEQIIFDEVIEEYIDDNSYTDYWGEEHLTQGGALGLVQKKRQVASSVYAYLNSEEDLDKGIDLYENEIDAKFERLIYIIEEVFKHGNHKIVVFAIFKKTLKYLDIRLKKRGYNSLVIHGQVDNRAEILESFRDNPDNHVLLSSEVGSEGLDMQFCDSMVNYDLPWNPMVVEQRIGRIDRFGQKSPIVHIYNFIVAGSIQEDIYMRLLERIGVFRGTIGDMEAILDSPYAEGSTKTIQQVYNNLERELFTTKLSEEEKKQRFEEICLAFEKEKQNLEELEKGLTDTLTNDAYFKEEIDRIRHKRSYVTEEELHNYLMAVIDKRLTTCNLVDCGENVYEIIQPSSDRTVLLRFLNQYRPDGYDNELAFNSFTSFLKDQEKIYVTFNQEKAYIDHSIIYLNIYHPIIQSCVKFFSSDKNDINSTFSFTVNSDDLLQSGKSYYMCIYKYITSRKVQSIIKKNEEDIPFVFDANTQKLVVDDMVIDRIYSSCQSDCREYNPKSELYESSLIENMRLAFLDASRQERKDRLNELHRHSESERLHNEAQTSEFYSIRIENLKQRIKEQEYDLIFYDDDSPERKKKERDLKRDKGLLEKHQRDLQEKLDSINEDPEISVDCHATSLVLIKIE